MQPSLLCLLPMLAACDGARILAFALSPGRSHWILLEPLFRELAARGHQITVFSSFPQKKPLANYTDVDFSSQLPPIISQFSVDMIKQKMPDPWSTIHFMDEVHSASCKVMDQPPFKKLLQSKGQYDLVITQLLATDCFEYFAHILDVPLISITSSVSVPWVAERTGLPDNPSYIPNCLMNFTPDMTLWQRLYNTAVLVYAKYVNIKVFGARTQAMVEKLLGQPLPPVEDTVAKTSLLFVNSYHALAQSRPFPPNVIEIGGIHVKERQPISKDLKEVLDNAKHGVIIMSFGSVVRSATLPKSMIMSFMNAFSKIPQTVIFKYEEELPEAPPNVIIRKWLSQRDLVEHENVVAVIAHGGLASTIETVYLGKPMIGVPFYNDQHVNVISVVRRGAGIKLDLNDITEEKVSAVLNEIINNPKYRENMRRLSLQFTDRPMTPLDTAVFWTEYVIRHKGAHHLKPASLHLAFYQYLLLDVIAVLLGSVIAIICVLYFILKYIISLFKLRKTSDSKKKKTN